VSDNENEQETASDNEYEEETGSENENEQETGTDNEYEVLIFFVSLLLLSTAWFLNNVIY